MSAKRSKNKKSITIEDLAQITQGEFARQDERIGKGLQEVSRRFDGVDRRFDGVDKNIQQIREDIGEIKLVLRPIARAFTQLVELEQGFKELRVRVERLEARADFTK